MISSEFMISILVFISIALFALGIYLYSGYRAERRELVKRIKQIDKGMRPEEKTRFFDTFKNHWGSFIGSMGTILKPKKEEELSHLRKTFLKAGYRGEDATLFFFGIKAFLAILFFVAFFLMKLYVFKTMKPLHFMIFSVLSLMIGLYLPNLWLKLKIASRKEKIQQGLPDALDLMVVCVEAGTGLDAAINRVGEEMKLTNKVLSEEFRLLNLELRAGKQRHDALRNLALRTDLEDVSSLVTLLIQTERFGTSIGQALRVHADSMRTKRYQKAEEIAQKMPVKLIFPLVLFIFPALLVVILGPAIISIFRTLLPALAGGR
ncbi:MAG: type II secretion system F family protein [Thermodesulfobacteriota bacterium]|nr:type II secretion system F family protein [Thermodesulfobacteriota bacterium]